MMHIQVSIIIVSYNTCQLLTDCLHSIYRYTKNLNFEIIVVDNASEDNSCETVKKDFPEVKLIESSSNIGFGKANNSGFIQAQGETILLLNSDTQLVDNSIKILYDFLRLHPQVGVCGGLLLNEKKEIGFSYGYRLSLRREILQFFNNLFLKPVKPEFYTSVQEVDYIMGADMMIRREVIERTKGFDPDFFLYCEETEWSFRIKKAGYQIKLVPDAKILHLEGASGTKKSNLADWIYKEKWFSRFLYFHKVYGHSEANRLFYLHKIRCTFSLICFSLLQNKKKLTYWKNKMEAIGDGYHRYTNLYP